MDDGIGMVLIIVKEEVDQTFESFYKFNSRS